VPLRLYQAFLFEISQVLRDLHLRFLQQSLKMAHAKRAATQELENAEPCLITEALVYLDEIHGCAYTVMGIYLSTDLNSAANLQRLPQRS
jgi:hypothetical protein